MPLYEFKCACGRRREEFFLMEEDKRLDCDYCGQEMGRLFTAPAIRIDVNARRCPPGVVETGTEYPKPAARVDHMADAEREIAQVIEQAPDLDGSGDCELSKL